MKLFLGLFFIITFLNAEIKERYCQEDLDSMIVHFYSGERAYNEKDYNKAMTKFQISKNASYSALESCAENNNYDFNLMYNYILGSENKMYEIEEDLLD